MPNVRKQAPTKGTTEGGRRPPPFVGACFRTFGMFGKLRRHQDPSKCIKIHANPSNPKPGVSGTYTIANISGNLHPEKNDILVVVL